MNVTARKLFSWSSKRMRSTQVALLSIPVAGVGILTSTVSLGASDERRSEEKPVVEEVFVTAQKRQERLQDVPISISVLNGADLDASTAIGVTEALGRVPGVAALSAIQGSNTLLSVRGVSGGAANFNGSSPIAYYLDSVPFGFVKSAFAPDSNAYDLERVEVLRGPQGTYYGASAQNGVVRVLTNDADLDRFEVKARASASTTEDGGNNSRIDSALNVPLVPGKLAARVVVGYQDLSGWIDKPNKRDANSGEIRNLRARLAARPIDDLSIDLSAWSSRSDYDAASISRDNRTSASIVADPIDDEYEIYGAKITYEFPGLMVTSSTGYLDYSNRNYLDYALIGLADTRLETVFQSKALSQELLLQSTAAGVWRWSVGGMYRDARDRLFQLRRQYAQPGESADVSKSSAVFGELTRLLADGKIEVTGGLRYFEDDVQNIERSRGTVTAVPSSLLVRSDASFDKLSPRVVVTWHTDQRDTVYASYAEGFRSGFPQNGNVVFAFPQFPPLKADNLKNYELGAKGSFWDGVLTADAAVFYMQWDDIQQTLAVNVGTAATPINVTALVNGQSASGVGFEFSLGAQPVDGLVLGANFSWNDLTMDSAVRAAPTGAPPGGIVLFDEGDRLNLSPEYTAGASIEYGFPMGGSGFRGQFLVSGNYTSSLEMRGLAGLSPRRGVGDSMLMSRASFSVEAPDLWSASLFVDNLNNEQGAPIRQSNFPADFDTHVRPRTYGVQIEYSF